MIPDPSKMIFEINKNTLSNQSPYGYSPDKISMTGSLHHASY